MKRKYHTLKLWTIIAIFAFCSLYIAPLASQASSFDVEAESAILVDFETGEVLFAKEADISLPPASMTKMMTEYLVLEAINNGDITWETTTEISDYAYSISANNNFSGVGLRQNVDYTVKDLYDAMVIYSDNATTIALAELIAGSEGEFVKMMNAKAEELGLRDYEFVNSTGLNNGSLGDNYPEGTDPEGENLMSARDTAKLAYHLIKDYSEVLDVSSIPNKKFEGHSMDNWNWMLPEHDSQNFKQFSYEGLDGLKTGHTDLAGYTFTGTAERDGQRLISVVMRTNSIEKRFTETAKLLDYGFNNFQSATLIEAGHQIEDESTLPVAKGKEKAVQVEAGEDLQQIIKDGEEENYSVVYEFDEDVLNEDGTIEAPFEAGTEVGKVVLTYDGEEDFGHLIDGEEVSVPLVTSDGVEKSNWFVLMLQAVGDFFVDLFESIKGLFN
ncbi:D-alanyl-D-alanine carboxypeptidase family protein [Piscibacillus halophilus]|uniref:D-alanyl-D-alanine carboxypeptidase family protein n=1 Tax=Piscibacillus halophilus TaxID=571933 RepID=UPI00158E2C53|nr:D-alanyl-D-alanine carboxypeptidase family protein [Piscibacillus halophilus]